MLLKSASKRLIEWKAMSSHIIIVRFYTNLRKSFILQCCAPTDDPNEQTEFFQQIQVVFDSKTKKDIPIWMRDVNTKIGNDNTGHDLIMGKEGLRVMNENASY